MYDLFIYFKKGIKVKHLEFQAVYAPIIDIGC